MRKTKIVATLGPATDDPAVLKAMLLNGLDVARFNFSHATHEKHRERIENFRRICEENGKIVAMLADTKGPEIRLGRFECGSAELIAGNQFTLCCEDILGNAERASVSCQHLIKEVSPGNRILLNDGLIELIVESVGGGDIVTRIITGGLISDRKGINAPGIKLNLPFISEVDRADIRFIVENGFDIVAASFVRNADDVAKFRKELTRIDENTNIRIIAKIENAEGVQNLDSILEVADGLMVARGDLGVEVAHEELPIIQKEIIKSAVYMGKEVITATQMLESMVNCPRPTRAETSDVANAIFDGTSAIMLSGETAVGKYAAEAVSTMAKIAETIENSVDYRKRFINSIHIPEPSVTNAISHATVTAAHELNAAAIITVTLTGITARNVAKFRPLCPIIACTPDINVARRLKLEWGVIPVLTAEVSASVELLTRAVNAATEAGYVCIGDLIVLTTGLPLRHSGTTNMLKIHEVGEDVLGIED